MQDKDKVMLLKQLAAGDITFTEAICRTKEIKKLTAIKETFTSVMKVDSWADAVTKYPRHALEDRLKTFIGEDPKKPSQKFQVNKYSNSV